jgi:membrane associated rhomboid family serine protease
MTTTDTPNQSWRFFTPIFLHVGAIHLILNMLAQLTAGAQIEREMGELPQPEQLLPAGG